MSVLICPVCREKLQRTGNSFVCGNRHSFDLSKEGYLNLLKVSGHRSRHPGDAPELCRARRAFLREGYYEPLRDFVAERITGDVVLDACCGEGYYTKAFAEQHETYGFDIAKDMVRLAAGQDKKTQYFVAGLHEIPVGSDSIDCLTHLFAPVHDAEFSRVLRKDGTMLSVLPGERHLFGLKEKLYDSVRLNDEVPPDSTLTLCSKERLRYDITLRNTDDILNLYRMTPYYYKTARTGVDKLSALETLTTTLDFVVLTYKKA